MDPILRLSGGVVVYPSKVVPHPKGDVLHGVRRSDPGFVDFGEAYFSIIKRGEIKGWKKHLRMTMNIVVPVGSIRFHLSADDAGRVETVELGEGGRHARLVVPPGVWMAFEGLGHATNLLMNLASLEHDPTEAVNREFVR